MPPEHQPPLAGTPAHCIVLTTTATEAQADQLARQIVEARLGACVQVQPLKSFYRWNSEVRIEP
ncbi:MAG: CutA1 divalent ion tolerance protein [Polaromonas sp.]|nr:CutA1 divalent ion tolerance protein [Polaromonas sp.]